MASLESFVSDAAIVIAHNAGFDRLFSERFSETFVSKPWACSMNEIDWLEEGFENARLSSIMTRFGLFHEGHRAIEDCWALLEMLAKPLPRSGRSALEVLLCAARLPTIRIWAESAPYDSRNVLKARGYKWSDGAKDGRRCWWISSERRLMPAPQHLESMASARILTAAGSPSEEADTLRRADGLAVRRLGWSIQLRAVETLARDIPAREWKKERARFYEFAHNHILRPDKILDHID